MKKSKNRIAIPIWNNCVSNVVDFANQLLLIDVEDNRDTSRTQVPFVQPVVHAAGNPYKCSPAQPARGYQLSKYYCDIPRPAARGTDIAVAPSPPAL